MSLKYNKGLIPKAKVLRKNMTPEEKHLWYDFLKDYTVRFQRQKAISSYIVDFYCHKAKLVVELDGIQHFTEKGQQNDEKRTEILKAFDLKVIRFSNYDINTDFDSVCEEIDLTVQYRLEMFNTNSD